MSNYAIDKVLRQANQDERFRLLFRVDLEATLRRCTPSLPEQAVQAFISGDVGTLMELGANRYLLASLGRRHLLGLDDVTYRERLKEACESRPAVRDAMYPLPWGD